MKVQLNVNWDSKTHLLRSVDGLDAVKENNNTKQINITGTSKTYTARFGDDNKWHVVRNGIKGFFAKIGFGGHLSRCLEKQLNSNNGIKSGGIYSNDKCEPYIPKLPGQAVIIPPDGQEKERIIGYYDSPFLNDKRLFGMYKSSGDNSGLAGTYLAHDGVSFKILKPCDGDGANHFSTYNDNNFNADIMKYIRTTMKDVSEEQIARFGNTDAMYVSYLLGGGVWDNKWSEVGEKLNSIYKDKLNTTVFPSKSELNIKYCKFEDVPMALEKFKGMREVVKYELHTGFEGRDLNLDSGNFDDVYL